MTRNKKQNRNIQEEEEEEEEEENEEENEENEEEETFSVSFRTGKGYRVAVIFSDYFIRAKSDFTPIKINGHILHHLLLLLLLLPWPKIFPQ